MRASFVSQAESSAWKESLWIFIPTALALRSEQDSFWPLEIR
jgi:hypothetical protein